MRLLRGMLAIVLVFLGLGALVHGTSNGQFVDLVIGATLIGLGIGSTHMLSDHRPVTADVKSSAPRGMLACRRPTMPAFAIVAVLSCVSGAALGWTAAREGKASENDTAAQDCKQLRASVEDWGKSPDDSDTETTRFRTAVALRIIAGNPDCFDTEEVAVAEAVLGQMS
jgi:hypothetical protein